MKRARLFLTAFLPLLAGSCDKPSTWDWFNTEVVARPDGVVLIWRRDLNQRRQRLWMDHGSESLTVESRFHAFATSLRPDGGFATRALQMDHRWTLGEGQDRQYPAYLLREGRVITHQCHRSADIVAVGANAVRCEQRQLPVYRQIGTRAEWLFRSGSSLVFAAGLDGRDRPCAVSLSSLRPDFLQPFGRLRHYSGGEVARDLAGRLAVSYLAPQTAYLVDHAGDDMPIYRAGCAGLSRIGTLLGSPALASQRRNDQFREFVDVVDIVSTEDPDDPALLLTWRIEDTESGFGQAYGVLRPKHGLQRLPRETEERLGFDGGLCMCTAFWAGDPDRILIDVSANGEKDRADVRFEVLDLKNSRMTVLQTSYPLG